MPELLPIVLSARKGNWQSFVGRKKHPKFIPLAEQVRIRDDHTCRYCGFRSDQYQEVINQDQNYHNNRLDNLVTACPMCAACFFLDCIGLDGKMGSTLIYLPEINQADLNHFCRALFSSMLKDTPYKGKLQAAYLSLSERSKLVDEVFGPNTHDPNMFGQTLIDSHLNEQQLNSAIFSELKLLPIRKFYHEQAEYWKKTVFMHIPL